MSAVLSIAATPALRTPYAAAPERIQPLRPVVRGPADGFLPPPPRSPGHTAEPGTRYTPASSAPKPGAGMYLRNGALDNTQTAYQALSLERQDSMELHIQTADGDIATISLAQNQSYSRQTRATASANAESLEQSTSSSNSVQVRLSVQGELDADETRAIDALLRQASTVAKNVFSGDMRQAADAAARIDIGQEGDRLGAFTLDVRSLQVQRAVAAYQSVARA